jgi:hypothetical protein
MKCPHCEKVQAFDERFCGDCGKPLPEPPPPSEEVLARYFDRLKKLAGDGVVEAWEEEELGKMRRRWGISAALDATLRARVQPLRALLPVRVELDIATIEGFIAGGRGVIRGRIGNGGEDALYDVCIRYAVAGAVRQRDLTIDVLKPGGSEIFALEVEFSGEGQYLLDLAARAADSDDATVYYRAEPLPFRVAPGRSSGPQSIVNHIDMSSARVVDASNMVNASSGAPQGTGAVLGRATWRELTLRPCSVEAWEAMTQPARQAEAVAQQAQPGPATTRGPGASVYARGEVPATASRYSRARLHWKVDGRRGTLEVLPQAYVVLGKHSANDIPLILEPDGLTPGTVGYQRTSQVSRRHLALRYDGSEVECIDLGSTYGVTLSTVGRVERERPVPVVDSCRILVGPEAPLAHARPGRTPALIELSVELCRRDLDATRYRHILDEARARIDDVGHLDRLLIGPSRLGAVAWTHLRRLDERFDTSYLMLFHAARIGGGARPVLAPVEGTHEGAELFFDDRLLWLRCGGQASASVQGRPVKPFTEHPLCHGDLVTIGPTEFVVDVPGLGAPSHAETTSLA